MIVHDLRDLLGGYVLLLIGIALLGAAFIAIAYFLMVGIGDCADPWAGCQTAMGVVE